MREKLLRELKQLDEQIVALKEQKQQLKDEYLSYLNDTYKDFIGKKVSFNECRGIIEGFFGGFKYAPLYGTINIIPVIYKVKKDGTASRNMHVFYLEPVDFEITVIES